MQDPLYREIILEHWKKPQNYGVLEHADIDVTELNPLCGDTIRIMARIKEGNIEEISFVSSGCAISTAAASLFTQRIKGSTVHEITKMKPEAFLDAFELTFTPARLKCALLAFSTFQKAIK